MIDYLKEDIVHRLALLMFLVAVLGFGHLVIEERPLRDFFTRKNMHFKVVKIIFGTIAIIVFWRVWII